MEIVELKNYTQAQFEDLKMLMSELSDRVDFTLTDRVFKIGIKNLLKKVSILSAFRLLIFNALKVKIVL